MAYFFCDLCQKRKFLKIAEKWDCICQKSLHYVDDIRTRQTYIISNPPFSVKSNICVIGALITMWPSMNSSSLKTAKNLRINITKKTS